MAKKRRNSRRGRNFVAIPFTTSVSLATLAASTPLKATLVTFGEDIFVVSVDLHAYAKDLAAGEGDPLECGLMHGDLTSSEIEECLQAELSDPDDIIAKEHARRPVRRAGIMISGDGGAGTHRKLAGGEAKRVTCKFSVGDGHALSAWVAHRGDGLTTGSAVSLFGTIYGRW